MQAFKKWSKNEIDELRKDYGVLLPDELEAKYKRSYSTIRNTATRYQIKSNGKLKQSNNGKRQWLQEEISLLVNGWNKYQKITPEMLQELGRSKESLRNKIKELGLKRDVFTKDQIEECKKRYTGGQNISVIARDMPRGVSRIRTLIKTDVKMRSISESKRQYKRNSRYFNLIDTSEKAYWLGFLYADGYNDEQHGAISLSLKADDKNHVQKFIDAIDYESNVKISLVNLNYRDAPYEKASVYLRDAEMSNDLARLGCIQNKSLKLFFPDIDNNLLPDFIRGYFDGDGCICKTKNGYAISFVGTFSMIQGIKQHLNLKNKILTRKNVFTLSIGSKIEIENFINMIYNNPSIYLDRKYEKIRECKKFYEQSRRYIKNFKTS